MQTKTWLSKRPLTSPRLLVHYDHQKELLLSCDVSPYGIGAVLSHQMEDGSEKPVAFTSQSLSSAEKKYAQLNKGWPLFYFYDYLLGRRFVIHSDHNPLQYLFSKTRPVPCLLLQEFRDGH